MSKDRQNSVLEKHSDSQTKLTNGVMVVGREFKDLVQPYGKEDIPDYLGSVDHSLEIADKDEYNKALKKQEHQLNTYVRELKDRHKSLVIVFQGRDAAGKSGATERIMQALDYDAAIFQAVHVGPPTEDEKAHPFLWRFGTCHKQPEYGQVRVFDRSWNERVLVEPVMGYVKKDDLRKSYAQIRAYEWLRVTEGAVLVKFWLDITKKEQEARFKKRADEKPWKMTDSDSIAREHWNQYTQYANEMFHRTGTTFAPWYVVASQDKKYSRVAVLETINTVLKQQFKG